MAVKEKKNLMAIDLDTPVIKMQSSLCDFFLLGAQTASVIQK